MPAATIWKGVIEFGGAAVPVRFYSAIQERPVRFRLLHRHGNNPVKQAMIRADNGEVVPNSEIRRGFSIAKDRYVMLTDAELAAFEPAESRSIRIEGFVPVSAIAPQWYERAYFLGPDENEAAYAALAAALSDGKLEGVARWVMRKRAYTGALQARADTLMMVTLRRADEVIPAGTLPRPEGRKLHPRELALTEQLVTALHSKFDPAEYHDEYRDRVLAFVSAKAKGRKPRLRLVKPPPATDTHDLTSVLTASLKSLRKGRLSA